MMNKDQSKKSGCLFDFTKSIGLFIGWTILGYIVVFAMIMPFYGLSVLCDKFPIITERIERSDFVDWIRDFKYCREVKPKSKTIKGSKDSYKSKTTCQHGLYSVTIFNRTGTIEDTNSFFTDFYKPTKQCTNYNKYCGEINYKIGYLEYNETFKQKTIKEIKDMADMKAQELLKLNKYK